jgi:hypothetical protein
MMMLRLAAVTLAVGALVGCSGSGTTGAGGGSGGSGGSSGDFEVTVGNGLTPSISWEGSGALGLGVAKYPGTSERVWVLSTASGTPFTSPVTYGTVPSGALSTW